MIDRAFAPVVPFDVAAIKGYVDKTDAELTEYIDEVHRLYLPVYTGRGHALHALGAAPDLVLRQLWMAARCYGDHGKLYLAKWPRHQFRRRRLTPLEAAIVSGDLPLMERVADVVGLDALVLLAGTEPEAMTHEIRVMTGYFRGTRIEDQADLAGCLAVLYWLALSAIADESVKSLETVRVLTARVLGDNIELVRRRAGGLGRMLALHDALAHTRPKNPEAVVDALAEHGRHFNEGLVRRAADDPSVLTTGEGALDTSSLAILAVTAALGVNLGPAIAARTPHADLAIPLAYGAALGHTADA